MNSNNDPAQVSTRPKNVMADLPQFDAHEAAPLYEVVKRYISEAIMVGKWGPGTVLPAENELATHFRVSVGTVRKALTALTSEGVLMRRRKTGTVVTGWSPLHNLRYFFQYFRLHDKSGDLVQSETKILDYRHDLASDDEAEKLQLKDNRDVIRLHRLRIVSGIKAMHERMVLPLERVPFFPEQENVPALIYQYLLTEHSIRIAAVRETVTAQLATEEDQTLLDVQNPHAVMVINDISFDQTTTPIILAEHRASTEHFSYINEIR
ncbi:GntR family transcriptional regulator [Vibrio xiamenensis]|uniref:GntR family transcriptional regulator n=1 Tax=Vibrio xiamenensis TaxID=861298 RepID=A0A1G8FZV2_9VIBR|nr:GntR family transcriptional regulator [Vibrio xiamenensis]SDH87600.1 GntR family transcriptional regulator [Vibrio xiamenensis]